MLFFSWVELRRKEVLSDVREIASVSLFEVIGVDLLLHLSLIIVSEDEQFFVCEFVDKFVGQLPQLTHNEGYISSKEPVKSTTVVLGHIAD